METITRTCSPLLPAIGAGLAVAAGVLGAYTYFVEPFWLDVTHPVIRLPALPVEFDGFTIAQLSDFHLLAGSSDREPVFRPADETNRPSPGAVALTGDYPGARGALSRLLEFLGILTER